MKKQTLITAISSVVLELENGSLKYNWEEHSRCNAGLLARAILNYSSSEMTFAIESFANFIEGRGLDPNWANIARHFCPIVGISEYRIFEALQEAGLCQTDIIHLENLSDPRILKMSGITDIGDSAYHTKSENLIKYLKAWKSLLLTDVKATKRIEAPGEEAIV